MLAESLIVHSIGSALCLFTVLQAGEASPTKPRDGDSGAVSAVDEKQVIQVIPVKHGNAHEILRVFQPLNLKVCVAVDGTTNSLVVRGAPAAVASAAELTATLDRPSEAPNVGDPVFIEVKHRDVEDLCAMIQKNFDLGSTRVGIDPINHLLIVNGNRDAAARIRALVERVDTPRAPLRLTFFFIRGEILNDGNVADAGSAPALPAKLRPVAAVLAETGFTNMELSAPLTTNATEDSFFSAGGRLAGGNSQGAMEFQVEGKVRPSSQPGHASIEVRGDVEFIPAEGSAPNTMFRAETTLVTRLGDYVVVAAAPSSLTSGEAMALVVRVDSAEPTAPAGR
ncbi:MAG: hypothetical protein HOP29_15465 [Phycisphaerales bacterium]|nr:hypothetical protein [Phycisphaerales bacterium]